MVGRCYIGIDGWEFRWDKRVALGESSKSSSVLCYSVYIYWEALDILDVDTDGRLLAQKVMGIRNLAKNIGPDKKSHERIPSSFVVTGSPGAIPLPCTLAPLQGYLPDRSSALSVHQHRSAAPCSLPMPKFSSRPLNPSPIATTLRRHPFLSFGLPFITLVIASSFALQTFTRTRYDLHDQKVTTMSMEEELGMSAKRKKVDIRDEYYVSLPRPTCNSIALTGGDRN